MKKPTILLVTLLFAYPVLSQKVWDGPATGGNWATATNWNNNTVPVTNDIVIFPTGISGTISNVNSGNNITLGGLIVRGNSAITFTNSSNRRITIANGSGVNDFYIETGASLVLGTNVDLTLASGTAASNTTAAISGVLVVNNNRTFDTNNGNVLTTVTGTLQNLGTVAGNTERLLFDGGGMYIHARAGGNIPDATWSATSTCKLTGLTWADAGNDNQPFGNLVIDCANMSGNRILGSNGLSIAGNLEIENTGTAVLRQGPNALTIGTDLIVRGGVFRIGDNTNRSLAISGNLAIEGGTLQLSSGNNAADRGTLELAGNFSHSGGIITETSAGRGVINFSGNTFQLFSKAATATISNNIDFAIKNGAIVDFGTSILNGSSGTFTLAGNAKIITANAYGFHGTGDNSGSIQVGGIRTYSSDADYEFSGTSTGIFTTTNNPQVRNFIVNNSTGNVTLSQPMTVNGTLSLNAGLLTTSAVNLLTISGAGSSTPATNSSFVDGPVAKIFAAPLAGFTFPVGKPGAGFRNIGITAPSAAVTFRAEFFRIKSPNGTLGEGLYKLSGCEYWELNRTAGTAGARVILSWENNSSCSSDQYVTEQTTLRVAHLSGGNWINEGYLSSTGSIAAGTITSGNIITGFSPFALAAGGPASNPLAVIFSGTKAFEKNNGVQIEWTNLAEKDVVNYIIERSLNGRDFSKLGTQSPLGNQSNKAAYNAFDASPGGGINFYRIKAEQSTGKAVYSIVLSITPGKKNQPFNLYPNPVNGKQVVVSLPLAMKGKYNLRIMNTYGQVVFAQSIISQGSAMTQALDLPLSITPGVYHMELTCDKYYHETKTFIVQ